jgi:large conductance mechanosensitive channel
VLLKGFKDFLLRGNVVDLAVAVVVGSAFTAVVNAFATDFLTPLIGLVGGGGQLGGSFTVHGQVFRWGAFVSQVITFVLTAGVVYFLVVLPMHAILDRRRRGVEQGATQPTQLELLTQIRDLLAAGQGQDPVVPRADGLGQLVLQLVGVHLGQVRTQRVGVHGEVHPCVDGLTHLCTVFNVGAVQAAEQYALHGQAGGSGVPIARQIHQAGKETAVRIAAAEQP